MIAKTFEDFLKECHAEDYHGTDDDMPDAFDAWMGDRDVQEICDYAERYIELLRADLTK